jgi:hypothetical protein
VSSTPPPPEPYNAPPTTRAEAAQSGYSAPPAAYAAPTPAETSRPTGSNRLGLIAFVVSLLGIVIGAILATLGGIQSGSLAQFAEYSNGTATIDPETLPDAANQIAIAAGALSVSAFLVWGVLALWGFIQGIIAAVKNRGRGWGIAAIILAVIGGGIVFGFFLLGATIGAAPYAS